MCMNNIMWTIAHRFWDCMAQSTWLGECYHVSGEQWHCQRWEGKTIWKDMHIFLQMWKYERIWGVQMIYSLGFIEKNYYIECYGAELPSLHDQTQLILSTNHKWISMVECKNYMIRHLLSENHQPLHTRASHWCPTNPSWFHVFTYLQRKLVWVVPMCHQALHVNYHVFARDPISNLSSFSSVGWKISEPSWTRVSMSHDLNWKNVNV